MAVRRLEEIYRESLSSEQAAVDEVYVPKNSRYFSLYCYVINGTGNVNSEITITVKKYVDGRRINSTDVNSNALSVADQTAGNMVVINSPDIEPAGLCDEYQIEANSAGNLDNVDLVIVAKEA